MEGPAASLLSSLPSYLSTSFPSVQLNSRLNNPLSTTSSYYLATRFLVSRTCSSFRLPMSITPKPSISNADLCLFFLPLLGSAALSSSASASAHNDPGSRRPKPVRHSSIGALRLTWFVTTSSHRYRYPLSAISASLVTRSPSPSDTVLRGTVFRLLPVLSYDTTPRAEEEVRPRRYHKLLYMTTRNVLMS